MDLAGEVLRSHRKAVSTKTKTWNSTKLGKDRTNSIKWPQIWGWKCSEPRLYSELRKNLFSLQFCIPWPFPSPWVFLHFCYGKYLFLTTISSQNHLPGDQGRKAQSDSVNSHSLDLTISLHLRYHLNPDALIPCRKQSCFEMFMGLRKRKNTSCGMFCVFQNSPLNCSLSFSPQATFEVFHGWFPPSGLAKHRGTKISAYWVFSSQNFMLLMLYR